MGGCLSFISSGDNVRISNGEVYGEIQIAVVSRLRNLESLNDVEQREDDGDGICCRKVESFGQFDVVADCSDHYYRSNGVSQPSKEWAKRIMYEWDILAKHLPESIYVRVYEDRMDILRAVIKGPAGTPYSDGLFLFDALFPNDYPSRPPLVHYLSHGLRLNPNLYKDGTVCLSLLGTWQGGGCEKWCSSNSTMLQVLLSIQGLILNAKPFFNEPGFSPLVRTSVGEKMSLAYNKNVFLVSCKMMLYIMRRPPKHFEDLVNEHFQDRGRAILRACRFYMAGAQPGCSKRALELSDVSLNKKCWFLSFWTLLRNAFAKVLPSSLETQMQKLFNDLLNEFDSRGSLCTEFLSQTQS